MSEALCQVEACDRPVRDATVCGACCGQLERVLGDVPALAEELDTTLARQTAIGDRNGKARSATKPLPYDPRASEALWVLRNTLVGWVRELDDGWLADTLADMARWLLARVNQLRVHPAGGEAVDEILAAVRDVCRVTDRPVNKSRFHVGPCPELDEDGNACPGEVRAAIPSSEEHPALMQCGTCGTAYEPTGWLRAGRRITRAMVGVRRGDMSERVCFYCGMPVVPGEDGWVHVPRGYLAECYVPSPEPRPLSRSEVDMLATYNAETARGIQHTPEWQRKMAGFRMRFDREHEAQAG